MITISLTLALLALSALGQVASRSPAALPRDEEKQWILAGLSLIRRLDCAHVTTINQEECLKVRVSPASRFVAHMALVDDEGPRDLVMTHPEVEGSGPDAEAARTPAGNLTGVLVLDPLADRTFGHPLFIFRIVAFNGSRENQLRQCLDNRGLMYRSECIHQEVKAGCPHVFLSAGQQTEEVRPRGDDGICEYQFLPIVTSKESGENLLRCVPHAASCLSTPQQRRQRRKRLHRRRVLLSPYLKENLFWGRDPQWISSLTRQEVSNAFLTQPPIRASTFPTTGQLSERPDDATAVCSAYERCDYALLLTSRVGEGADADPAGAGGSQKRHLIDKLRSLGFDSRYLSVFSPEERPAASYHFFDFPVKEKGMSINASIKKAFRAKLHKLCHTPRCVSTLFLYLNNYVLPNGDMLISNGNRTSSNDRYGVSELLSDLSGCHASLIFTIVDQNFGGILLQGLKLRSSEFPNLVLLSATRQASAPQSERMGPRRPLSEFFYPHHYAFRLGHYDLYGVEDLLTYALENLPLTHMLVGEIEKNIRTLYPHMELGSFYGSRVQAHASPLFTKPVATSRQEGGFLQGRLSGQARAPQLSPRRYVAGCVSLSPIDWLRNYLPAADHSQRR